MQRLFVVANGVERGMPLIRRFPPVQKDSQPEARHRNIESIVAFRLVPKQEPPIWPEIPRLSEPLNPIDSKAHAEIPTGDELGLVRCEIRGRIRRIISTAKHCLRLYTTSLKGQVPRESSTDLGTR